MRTKNTPTYMFTNPHPNGIKTDQDCVYRAISIATDKDWLTVYDELTALGRELLSPPNSSRTLQAYLDKIAERIPVKYERGGSKKRHTPKTLPKTGTFVVSQAHHLTAVKNGKVRDTWDTSDRSAYIIWRMQ